MNIENMDRITYNRSRIERSLIIQVCEAKRLKKAKGVFCTIHYQDKMCRTETIWFTRNPAWSDEFYFNIYSAKGLVKILIHEERRKRAHKKLGEVTLNIESLNHNERSEKWYPIIGKKQQTIGDIRIRLNYLVEILLPSEYYAPLLNLILSDNLSILKILGDVTKEKSQLAHDLVYIFYSRNKVEQIILSFVNDELSRTLSPEVLFRSNTVCTKLIDSLMKLVGNDYLKSTIAPVIEEILSQSEDIEVHKVRLKEGEDYTPHLIKLTYYCQKILNNILNSIPQCPQLLRRIFKYLYHRTPLYLNNRHGLIKYIAVTSFIFLRFFVPAIMTPKVLGITNVSPDENQSRTCSLIAGVMQKLANLAKYREHEQYLNELNNFLEIQMKNTMNFIDNLVDVEDIKPTEETNYVNIDRYMASLLRHILKYKEKFVECSLTNSDVSNLLIEISHLELILDKEKKLIEEEELGFNNSVMNVEYKEIERLVSEMIEKGITQTKIDIPKSAIEGKDIKRQRSSSFASRAHEKIKGFLKRKGSKGPKFEIETFKETNGSESVNNKPSSEKLIFHKKPCPDESSNNPSNINNSIDVTIISHEKLQPNQSNEIIEENDTLPKLPLKSPPKLPLKKTPKLPLKTPLKQAQGYPKESNGTRPKFTLKGTPKESNIPPKIPLKRPIQPQLNDLSKLPAQNVDSLPRKEEEIVTHDSNSYTKRASHIQPKIPIKKAPPKIPFKVPPKVPIKSPPKIKTPAKLPPKQTPKLPSVLPEESIQTPMDETIKSEPVVSPIIIPQRPLPPPISDEDFPSIDDMIESRIVNTLNRISEEEFEELPDEDVEKYKINSNRDSLIDSLKEYDSLINKINNIKIESKRDSIEEPCEIVPQLMDLEQIIGKLDDTVLKTTPSVTTYDQDEILCHYCRDIIEPESKYYTVMELNFHEHHLICKICGIELGECGFQWYNDNPYCVECYSKSYGNFPTCDYCKQPIFSMKYTLALNKAFHTDHFNCTICHAPFVDGVYYNIDNKPYCYTHRTSKEESDLPVCGYCKKPIWEESYIEAMDNFYHPEHFLCDICNVPLTGEFVTFDGNGKACEKHF